MKSYKEQTFLAEFKSFLDEHVDCRLENLQTEDNRTANHEDRTGELESKVEELESKVEELESELSYHEDRIGSLETNENRIDILENSLELLTRFNNQEVQALVDSRIKHLVLAGDLHLSLTTRNES
jgi:TolA-binding protein|tara:strand:+ start:134 stop:511 length:378 start_codon:yes stop_codon:yes gene_type:complete